MEAKEMKTKSWKIFFLSLLWVFFTQNYISNQHSTAYSQDLDLHPISVIFEPVTKALENKPIEIKIKISGFDPRDKVQLHFRDQGETEFYAIPFGLDMNTQEFIATIDERYHSNETIEYFVEIIRPNGSQFRYPEDKLSYYEIKSYKNSAKYIRLILYFLLIIAPALLYYMTTKLFKVHVKRTTSYQQKLNKRRRQLSKQREKHYQEYLQKLSGAKTANNHSIPTMSRRKRSQNIKYVDMDEKLEPAQSPVEPTGSDMANATPKPKAEAPSPPTSEVDERVSTNELKRELDEILNAVKVEKPTSQTPSVPPVPPPKPTPQPAASPPQPNRQTSIPQAQSSEAPQPELDSRAAWHLKKLMEKRQEKQREQTSLKTPQNTGNPKSSPQTVISKTGPIPIQKPVRQPVPSLQLEKTDPNLRIDHIVNDADLFDIEDEEVSASLEAEFKAAIEKQAAPQKKAAMPPSKSVQSGKPAKPGNKAEKPSDSNAATTGDPQKHKDLNKSERNQILDILGLDDI